MSISATLLERRENGVGVTVIALNEIWLGHPDLLQKSQGCASLVDVVRIFASESLRVELIVGETMIMLNQ